MRKDRNAAKAIDLASPLAPLLIFPREDSNVLPFPSDRHSGRMARVAAKIISRERGMSVEKAVARRADELGWQQVPLSAALVELDRFEASLRRLLGERGPSEQSDG